MTKIRLLSSKKEDVIDLKFYLARKSTSERDTMVLEAVEKGASDKMVKVAIKFKNSSIFQEIYRNIRRDIIELLGNKIEQWLG